MFHTKFKANYSIFPEHKLVLEYQGGIILAEDLIYYKNSLAEDPKFSSCYNILVDIRDAMYTGKLKNVNNYVNFLKDRSDVAGKRKVAILTNHPNQVVMAFMYQNMQQKLEQIIEVFSSLAAAKHWLNTKLSEDEIEKELKKLSLASVNTD